MARKRVISPELFTSESVASLPIPTRYTWVGLLCYLDDMGRGKDNPALIKAAVWPLDDSYTSRKVASDVQKLVQLGSLCRFECCGVPLLHVPTWSLWQKISHPTASKLCPCPGHEPVEADLHRHASEWAPEPLRSGSGATLRNVVQSKLDQGSSSDHLAVARSAS